MGSSGTGLLAYGGVVCLLAAVIIVISDMKPLSETFYSSLYNINNYIIIRDCFLLGPDTFKPVNIITLLRVQDFFGQLKLLRLRVQLAPTTSPRHPFEINIMGCYLTPLWDCRGQCSLPVSL